MDFPWEESRRAFIDAVEFCVRTAAQMDGQWEKPGLGEWDVRALVGHTSRALLTLESYLTRPAIGVDSASAAEYFRATSAAGAAVATRGRESGQALGG